MTPEKNNASSRLMTMSGSLPRSLDLSASSMPEAYPRVSWFLLRTVPNHESRVAQNLEQRGFPVYLPTVTEKRRNRPGTYERPLFARYLFAQFTWPERWRITATPGLTEYSIVEFDGVPATLDDAEIERVRTIEREERERMSKPKQRGQVIELRVGHAKIEGQLTGQKRGFDVVVLRRAA